jgi:iron complex transport system ATP-binding protein
MTPAIRASGLTFSYRRAPVFRDFDLRVEPGTMTALLGPNGSGKTTFVRLASGSLRPAAGSIAVFGDDVARLTARERARRIAVVPQESHPVFEATVLEMVLLGRFAHLGFLGLESDDDLAIARAALARTDALHLADRPFVALSGGERQRVLLARALAQQARLLLLDEPTAFLDLQHRLEVHALLLDLVRRDGLTVLVVSHDLNLAARYADRLVLLRCGAIAVDGPPEAVLRPDAIRDVYRVEVEIGRDPSTGRPYVVPLSPTPRA